MLAMWPGRSCVNPAEAVESASAGKADITIVASVIHERFLGVDTTKRLTVAPGARLAKPAAPGAPPLAAEPPADGSRAPHPLPLQAGTPEGIGTRHPFFVNLVAERMHSTAQQPVSCQCLDLPSIAEPRQSHT